VVCFSPRIRPVLLNVRMLTFTVLRTCPKWNVGHTPIQCYVTNNTTVRYKFNYITYLSLNHLANLNYSSISRLRYPANALEKPLLFWNSFERVKRDTVSQRFCGYVTGCRPVPGPSAVYERLIVCNSSYSPGRDMAPLRYVSGDALKFAGGQGNFWAI
jgi:hypothetical protein